MCSIYRKHFLRAFEVFYYCLSTKRNLNKQTYNVRKWGEKKPKKNAYWCLLIIRKGWVEGWSGRNRLWGAEGTGGKRNLKPDGSLLRWIFIVCLSVTFLLPWFNLSSKGWKKESETGGGLPFSPTRSSLPGVTSRVNGVQGWGCALSTHKVSLLGSKDRVALRLLAEWGVGILAMNLDGHSP